MKPQTLDLAIIGGGCAGLSLARELAKIPDWEKEIAIFEAREHYENDRSWCFWEPLDRDLASSLNPLIIHRWHSWRFSSDHFTQIHQVNNQPYCYVSAQNFYDHIISHIDKSPHIRIYKGKAVQKIEPLAKGFCIAFNDGTVLHALRIIDTRTPSYQYSQQAKLWQIFYGLEIKTREKFFDRKIVGLMDNMAIKKNIYEFIYILPFSENHALIELTHFTSTLQSAESLKETLENYMHDHLKIPHFEVIRHEYGCLPMGLRATCKKINKNYIYAGTPSGALRASSGYAFLRIQRWARQCAKKLYHENKLISQKNSHFIINRMDQTFLNVLHDKPGLSVFIFQSLAQKVGAASLARFLNEEAKIIDYWRVIKALPKKIFIFYAAGLNYLSKVRRKSL